MVFHHYRHRLPHKNVLCSMDLTSDIAILCNAFFLVCSLHILPSQSFHFVPVHKYSKQQDECLLRVNHMELFLTTVPEFEPNAGSWCYNGVICRNNSRCQTYSLRYHRRSQLFLQNQNSTFDLRDFLTLS